MIGCSGTSEPQLQMDVAVPPLARNFNYTCGYIYFS